jgi:hypothetical protein
MHIETVAEKEAESPNRSKTSSMKFLSWILFTPFIAVILAQQLQVHFINSTGLTVNSIPYSTRLYWMKQANEALFNYSGPWYLPRSQVAN